jgi:type II secretory pathway pseudopilin PulG
VVGKLPNHKITRLQIPVILRSRKSAPRSERGYILITLILFVALIVVAAMVLVPAIAFQVKRDREEELIHRGVQYSRATKHFVKKFGRYPARIEELENTNQIRFLRRRYKDPITGKDFKILRMGDVQLAFGGGAAAAGLANGLNPAARLPGGTIAQVSGPDANGIPATMPLAGGPAAGANLGSLTPGAGTATGTNGTGVQNSGNAAGDEADAAPKGVLSTPDAGLVKENSAPGAQVFGGGPMVGVASTSREKSIRVFNKKDHYYQWQFIYDPSTDRGGLLTTPTQPSLQGATPALQLGVPGAPGSPNTSIQGQPGQPTQPGIQPPQMPPDQEQAP